MTSQLHNDFAYSTIEEFEGIVGYTVNDAFRDGWRMARTSNTMLGIKKSLFPSLEKMLDYYTLFVTQSNNGGYTAWLEPSFGAASGVVHEVHSDSIIGVAVAIDESCAKNLTYNKI